jgi:hypothetical protein
MPLHKFGKSDILHNQIKTHPSSTFFVYDSSIYYNNNAVEAGKNVTNVNDVPVGHVSMFELNVDRAANADATAVIGVSSSVPPAIVLGLPEHSLNVKNTGYIYPFVVKGVQQVGFRDMTRDIYQNDYNAGDILTGSYKMSSSIARQRYNGSHAFLTATGSGAALKNSLSFAARLGDHYNLGVTPVGQTGVNVIQIPSIFYGSEIKKGTVDLKYYMTGNVIGRLKDSRQNGALIQSEGTEGSANDGQIAGVVLYKEGFIILTGSWDLSTVFAPATTSKITDKDVDNNSIVANPQWLNFGFGANDKVTARSNLTNGSASFSLDFAGTHKVPTVTMLAHANKGELNFSNNPTYFKAGQTNLQTPITGTHLFREQELEIKNIHSASYADPSGSLVKTTYITKVGIYDEKKKLVGIASLAKPVKKTEDRDLTFKLKLDI